jgi:hypothetical protein
MGLIEERECPTVRRVVENRFGRSWLTLSAVPVEKEHPTRGWRVHFGHQLQTGSKHNPAIEIETDSLMPIVAISDPNPLHHSAWPRKIHPVENAFQVPLSLRSRVDCAPDRASSPHQIIETRHAGACCSTTHLCQVGTSSSYCAVEVELPETQGPTEIDNWDPEAPIGRDKAASGTEHEPTLTMGRENVNCPLKPVSTTTSDEEIGEATDAKGSPRPQIDALVNLGLSVLLNSSEVLFEIR